MLRKTLVLTLLLAICAIGGGAGAGVASAADDGYRPYALIRERLVSCSLDRTWRQLGTEARRRCKALRRLYVLYAAPGESYRYHVHCRTRKCPRTPEGEPDARGPIPSDAQIFR